MSSNNSPTSTCFLAIRMQPPFLDTFLRSNTPSSTPSATTPSQLVTLPSTDALPLRHINHIKNVCETAQALVKDADRKEHLLEPGQEIEINFNNSTGWMADPVKFLVPAVKVRRSTLETAARTFLRKEFAPDRVIKSEELQHQTARAKWVTFASEFLFKHGRVTDAKESELRFTTWRESPPCFVEPFPVPEEKIVSTGLLHQWHLNHAPVLHPTKQLRGAYIPEFSKVLGGTFFDDHCRVTLLKESDYLNENARTARLEMNAKAPVKHSELLAEWKVGYDAVLDHLIDQWVKQHLPESQETFKYPDWRSSVLRAEIEYVTDPMK